MAAGMKAVQEDMKQQKKQRIKTDIKATQAVQEEIKAGRPHCSSMQLLSNWQNLLILLDWKIFQTSKFSLMV